MRLFILSTMCYVLLWPVLGTAQLYKWTDDLGNFHITDTPPPGSPKKPSVGAVPAPQTTVPKKAMVRPTLPMHPQAQIHLVPAPTVAVPSVKEVFAQQATGGLNPNQATVTSFWQTFEGPAVTTKAPVHRWKDEQDLDHFTDIVPTAKGGLSVDAKLKEVPARQKHLTGQKAR
ncbi:MAG: DUF4124 domain-containing protein [Nitrospira sp. BO4]|nr:DUF4124 domain-containing protein [Nitrospira sp. BO4]